MKRTSQITLTLMTAAMVAGCAQQTQKQRVKCYQHPSNPSVCSQNRVGGYVPVYYPMFTGGYYYDSYGRSYSENHPTYKSAATRYTATTGRSLPSSVKANGGSVSRGGFGSTGAGRSVGA